MEAWPINSRHPATEDSADFEFAILDIESEILDVATALCVCIPATSMCAYLLPPERLAALSPANRLILLEKPLSRLQNRLSASAPRQNETDQKLREDSGQQTRVASEPASQPATIGESNALASVPVPPSIIASAKKPRKPTFFNHGGATASAPGAPEPNVPPLPPCTFEDGKSKPVNRKSGVSGPSW